jgi:hypothetical protein
VRYPQLWWTALCVTLGRLRQVLEAIRFVRNVANCCRGGAWRKNAWGLFHSFCWQSWGQLFPHTAQVHATRLSGRCVGEFPFPEQHQASIPPRFPTHCAARKPPFPHRGDGLHIKHLPCKNCKQVKA